MWSTLDDCQPLFGTTTSLVIGTILHSRYLGIRRTTTVLADLATGHAVTALRAGLAGQTALGLASVFLPLVVTPVIELPNIAHHLPIVMPAPSDASTATSRHAPAKHKCKAWVARHLTLVGSTSIWSGIIASILVPVSYLYPPAITLAALFHVAPDPGRRWPVASRSDALRLIPFDAKAPRPTRGHTHGTLANLRYQFGQFANAVAEHFGVPLYHFQAAERELHAGNAAFRAHLSTKDSTTQVNDTLPAHAIVTDTDSLYYCEGTSGVSDGYAAFLCSGHVVISWAVSPRCVPFHTDETTVVWNSDSTITMVTRGSSTSTYRHHLWNLDNDLIVSEAYGWTTVSKVHARRLSDLTPHLAYVIVPQTRFRTADIARPDTLPRFKPTIRFGVATVEGDYATATGAQRVVRASPVGTTASYCTTPASWAAAITIAEDARRCASSEPKVVAAIASLHAHLVASAVAVRDPCGLDTTADDPVQAVATKAVARLIATALLGLPTDLDSRAYEPYTTDVTTDGRAKAHLMTEGPQAFSDEGFFPTASDPSTRLCIQSRIEQVSNGSAVPTKRHAEFVGEFVQLILDEAGAGDPIPLKTMADVIEAQDRPAQLQAFVDAAPDIIRTSYGADLPVLVRAFQKNEAYPKMTAPRNISTMHAAVRVLYSMFTLTVASYLKRCRWYAFGHHPDALLARVSALLAECGGPNYRPSTGPGWVMSNDQSRWDGHCSATINAVYRTVFRALLNVTGVATDQTEMLERLFAVHDDPPAIQGQIRYSVGDSRLSGSPETSIANSIANAFLSYVTLRVSGLPPRDAYASMGFYGGDDSLVCVPKHLQESPAQYATITTSVMKDYGFDIKATLCRAHSVAFLGRYFVDVAGDLSDYRWYADIPRQLSKLHIKCNTFPDPVAALMKATGLAATDADTPVLREWALAVARASTRVVARLEDAASLTYVASDLIRESDFARLDGTIDPAKVVAHLSARGPYPAATTEFASDVLGGPAYLAACFQQARNPLAVGLPAITSYVVPQLAKSFATRFGPASLCATTSAKLGLDVPIECSVPSAELPHITAGRVTECIVRKDAVFVDVFGGPGGFAARASRTSLVVSCVLPRDAERHAALVRHCGDPRSHSMIVTTEPLSAALRSAISAASQFPAADTIVYFDPPWTAAAEVQDLLPDLIQLAVSGVQIIANLPPQLATTLARCLHASRHDSFVLTHKARVVTAQSLVASFPPTKGQVATASSSGLCWHEIVLHNGDIELSPLVSPLARYDDAPAAPEAGVQRPGPRAGNRPAQRRRR